MKTITFEGKQYEDQPDWVEWVAMDKHGVIWGYEKEPIQGVTMYRNTGGRIVEIGVIKFNWQDSLTKV